MAKVLVTPGEDVLSIDIEVNGSNELEIVARKADGSLASPSPVLAKIVVGGGLIQMPRGLCDVPGIDIDPASPQHINSPAV